MKGVLLVRTVVPPRRHDAMRCFFVWARRKRYHGASHPLPRPSSPLPSRRHPVRLSYSKSLGAPHSILHLRWSTHWQRLRGQSTLDMTMPPHVTAHPLVSSSSHLPLSQAWWSKTSCPLSLTRGTTSSSLLLTGRMSSLTHPPSSSPPLPLPLTPPSRLPSS